jgi:hypothetical protein
MAYSKYASITIDNTKVSGSSNLTNFPVLVSGTYDGTGGEPDLRTTANGGEVQNTDATGGADGATTVPADLVFSPNTDGSSPYDFEIEKYDASTGEIVAWVEIPALDYNDDTVFYMVYGDSNVTTSQEDVAGTWANAYNVWHMSTVNDSYASADGVNTGLSATSSGKIAGAFTWAGGGTDRLQVGDLATVNGTRTISAWVKWDGTPANMIWFSKGFTGMGEGDVTLWVLSDGKLKCLWRNIGSAATSVTTASSHITANTWHLIHWVIDSSYNMTFYVDGELAETWTSKQVDGRGDRYHAIGNEAYDYSDPFYGIIDEVKYLSTNRSADWIKTEYNNQNSPSTFYTMGSETSTTNIKKVLGVAQASIKKINGVAIADVSKVLGVE